MRKNLNQVIREAKEKLPQNSQEGNSTFLIPDNEGNQVEVNIKTGKNGTKIHTNYNDK